MTKYTEEEQADILEKYLAGLEQGDAFNIPDDLNDSELVALLKLGKDLRVSNSMPAPSEKLLRGFTKQKRTALWKLLIPLPVMGAALLAVLFITLHQPANTVHLSSGDITNVETELAAVEEIDHDLEVALADLDATLTEVDEILADDSFSDIEAAIDDAAL